MSKCIFCKIIAGTIPAKFELKEDRVVAIQDISPKAPVHILVVPTEHIAQISDLKSEQVSLAGELIYAAQRIAKQKNKRLSFSF